MESGILGHLQKWKGKAGNALAEDDEFFEVLISGRTLGLFPSSLRGMDKVLIIDFNGPNNCLLMQPLWRSS